MTLLGLALRALCISVFAGLVALLLTYPVPRLRLGARQPPAWSAFFKMKLVRPFADSSVVVPRRRRLLIGGGSALPIAVFAGYAGLLWPLVPALGVFVAAPEAYIAVVSARDKARREAQVPRMLEALCQALRAGKNLYQSLERAAQEVGPPLGDSVQQALDRFAVSGDMAAALNELGQGAASRRLGALLDVLVFDLEEGVAGTSGEMERLESLRETMAQEDGVKRELATRTAGTRFNLRLVSVIIPGTILFVVATDSSLLAPLLSHPLGNVSLALAAVAYLGTLYLSHRWSRIEL